MSLRTHLVNLVTLRKRHPLVAKEDLNGYDKSTLSYEKELPNRRVVAKVRKAFLYTSPSSLRQSCSYTDAKD